MTQNYLSVERIDDWELDPCVVAQNQLSSMTPYSKQSDAHAYHIGNIQVTDASPQVRQLLVAHHDHKALMGHTRHTLHLLCFTGVIACTQRYWPQARTCLEVTII